MEEEKLIKEFLQSLSEKEFQAYLIAKQHLGSLFDISNCNGFLEFKARKQGKSDKPPTL